MKTLGRQNVTPDIMNALSNRLSDSEKSALLIEAASSTDWVYDAIRKMQGGEPAL